MPFFNRRSGIATTAAASVVALLPVLGLARLAAPRWAESTGVDVWSLPHLSAQLSQSREEKRRLQTAEDRLRLQIDVSDRIAAVVAEGRLTLAAAVDEVKRVNCYGGSFDECLRHYYHEARTPQERLARYLMGKVARQLARDPARRDRVIRGLEEEYRSLEG